MCRLTSLKTGWKAPVVLSLETELRSLNAFPSDAQVEDSANKPARAWKKTGSYLGFFPQLDMKDTSLKNDIQATIHT